MDSAKTLRIQSRGRILLLQPESIDWVEAQHNYVRLYTRDGMHTVRETLTGIERRLDRLSFRRVHRSRIVNVDRICAIEPWRRGDAIIVLDNGCRLKASRSYREQWEAPA
jgi:two-component system LytT family response regulator